MIMIKDDRNIIHVINALCSTFGVNPQDLFSKSRGTQKVSFARQVGMTALINQYGYSLQDAAYAFFRKDHGTALHAKNAITNAVATDKRSAEKVKLFLSILANERSS